MLFNFSRNRSAAGMMGWNRKISNVATRIPALLSQNTLGRSHVVSKPKQQDQRLSIFLISRESELRFSQLCSNCLSNNSSPCSIVLQSVKIVQENGIAYTSSSSVHLEFTPELYPILLTLIQSFTHKISVGKESVGRDFQNNQQARQCMFNDCIPVHTTSRKQCIPNSIRNISWGRSSWGRSNWRSNLCNRPLLHLLYLFRSWRWCWCIGGINVNILFQNVFSMNCHGKTMKMVGSTLNMKVCRTQSI